MLNASESFLYVTSPKHFEGIDCLIAPCPPCTSHRTVNPPPPTPPPLCHLWNFSFSARDGTHTLSSESAES